MGDRTVSADIFKGRRYGLGIIKPPRPVGPRLTVQKYLIKKCGEPTPIAALRLVNDRLKQNLARTVRDLGYGSTDEYYFAHLLRQYLPEVPPPARQFRFGDFRVDFLFKHGIVVEIDGPYHEMKITRRRDREHDAFLEDMGLLVLRFATDMLERSPMAPVSEFAMNYWYRQGGYQLDWVI